VREPIDIVARRPAFPRVARLRRRPAGELSSLDIDEQLGPGRREHDEVEVLDRYVAKSRAACFIDGDVAEPLFLQERFECGSVWIAAIHGDLDKAINAMDDDPHILLALIREPFVESLHFAFHFDYKLPQLGVALVQWVIDDYYHDIFLVKFVRNCRPPKS